MLVNLEVQRFDPERDSAPHVQTFTVEVAGGATVLEALMQIKDENDGSLSFRRSCRSAICGSCTMEHERARWARLQDAAASAPLAVR